VFFAKLSRKIEITGTLRCVTALRIGAGKDGGDVAATDLPVLRDGLGRPLLPGSSLKGVVRSSVEALLRAMPADPAKMDQWACDPFSQDQRCVPDLPGKEERKAMERMTQPERTRHQRKRLEKLCMACRTFGAPGYASHVLFRDAIARDGVHVERRDGVAIDRDLGRVSGARKYDFEVVSQGSRFDFGLTIDGAREWQEGLVVLGLQMLDEGFARVGGATSRGLGRVALDGATVRILDVKKLSADGALPISDESWATYAEGALQAWQHYVRHGAPAGEG